MNKLAINQMLPFEPFSAYIGLVGFCLSDISSAMGQLNGFNLYETDVYKCYFYIYSNFHSDLAYLFSTDLDNESMEYIPVQRDVRFSSEALLNLYNLIHVGPNYRQALVSMYDGKSAFPLSLEKYLYPRNPLNPTTGKLTIISKLNIAKDNGFDDTLDFLQQKGYLKKIDEYIHSSIFIQPNNYNIAGKLNKAKELATINFKIYRKAFECLCGIANYNYVSVNCNFGAGSITYNELVNRCIKCIDGLHIEQMPTRPMFFNM